VIKHKELRKYDEASFEFYKQHAATKYKQESWIPETCITRSLYQCDRMRIALELLQSIGIQIA
jgi:hypothetical protein